MASNERDWPIWSFDNAGGLGRYIVPDIVRAYGRFPALSDESAIHRLQAVWDALTAIRIGYAAAAPLPIGAGRGDQVIRPPGEVLRAPGAGTCLDVALVLAGACEHAGLHAVVLVLDPPVPGAPGHALVAVLLSGPRPDTFTPGAEWRDLPTDFRTQVRRGLDGPPRPIAVLDPIGCTVDLGTSATIGQRATLPQAMVNGYRYLVEGWRLRIAAAVATPAHIPAQVPARLPLRPNTVTHDPTDSALRLTRPEYEITPFQYRAELSLLDDLAERTEAGTHTGIVVLGGVGGSGKTRLALQAARQLHRKGWYTGALREDAGESLSWLSHVRAPLLVVVDYADARVRETNTLLAAVRDREGPPALIVLVCRSLEGDWLDNILEPLHSDSHQHFVEHLRLPDTHPAAQAIIHRTRARLNPSLDTPEPSAVFDDTNTTTLDLVLRGWISARRRDVPDTREMLYDEVLKHELQCWVRAFGAASGTAANREILRRAGAYLTMLAPAPSRVDETLTAIEPLRGDPIHRSHVTTALTDCLTVPGDRSLAIRPDPVGDHHLLRTLQRYPALLTATPLDSAALTRALLVFTRAAQNDQEAVVQHIRSLRAVHREDWGAFADVAASRRGPVATVLQEAAADPDEQLPWDEISDRLPHHPDAPAQLLVAIDERRLRETDAADLAGRAQKSSALYLSLTRAGDPKAALAAAIRASELWRQLAANNPAQFLPSLAGALTDEAAAHCSVNDPDTAKLRCDAALRIFGDLGAGHEYDAARALNNSAVIMSDLGDNAAAVLALEDAVQCYRDLSDTSPDHRAELADALLNLALAKSECGYVDEPVVLVDEAVRLYRDAETTDEPATDRLARALNSQGNLHSLADKHQGALAALDEAVGLFERLDSVNQAFYATELAEALHNRADEKAALADLTGALADARRAVGIYRAAADADPELHSIDLAQCLVNLSVRLSELGQRQEALDTAVEAADALDESDGIDFLIALNNLAVQSARAGDRQQARTVAARVVAMFRDLAEDDPAAHTSSLAAALNNYAIRLAESGDHGAARTAAEESVTLRRKLHRQRPALVRSLITLSNRSAELTDFAAAAAAIDEAVDLARHGAGGTIRHADLALALSQQSDIRTHRGDHLGALRSAEEAVTLYRRLAEKEPDAYRATLADALHNRSARRAEVSDLTGACRDAEAALADYRELNRNDPGAFDDDVARTQNNLALRYAEAGSPRTALDLIDSALETWRSRAADDPAAFGAVLAEMLVNRAARCADLGDAEGALAAVDEAIVHYRALAHDAPGQFTTDLAAALGNRADLPGRAEELNGADLDEAERLYRTALPSNPSGVGPDLAEILARQASRYTHAADHSRATTAIAEAVALSEPLVSTAPIAAIDPITRILTVFSHVLTAADRADSVDAAWDSTLERLPDGVLRAELRAARLKVRHALGHPTDSEELALSIAEATRPDDPQPPYVQARARRAVRDATRLLTAPGTAVPDWTTADLPASDLRIIHDWTEATPDDRADSVSARVFVSDTLPRTIATLRVLEPDRPELTELEELLHRATHTGREAAVEELRALARAADLIDRAITATDPAAFLHRHHDELLSLPALRFLEASDDARHTRYAAILFLSHRHSVSRALDIADTVETASELALHCVDTADLEQLAIVARACPQVLETEPLGEFFSAVLQYSTDHEKASTTIETLLTSAAPISRRAFEVHLRRMGMHAAR